jgi:tetratricopeptide (TPR) repeat protein
MKIPRRVLLVLAAFFSIGAAQFVRAQTVYDLKGKVYGPNSKPVPNVLVILENNARAQIGQDITGTEGIYEFNGLVAGTYYISVKPDETQFQAIFQRIDLINTSIGGRSASTETVDFSLRYAPRRDQAVGTVYAQTVPPEAEKQYLSAVKSLTRGDKEQATRQLARAIKIFPTYFLALQQLGVLYVEEKSYEEAIEPLKKAIQVNSKAARTHCELGIAYLNLDRPNEAIQELSVAHTIDPKLFVADLYQGMALISTGDLDKAERSLKEALAVGGSTQARAAHLYLASIYNTRKQYQMAIQELETYLRENPKADNVVNVKEAIKKIRAKL